MKVLLINPPSSFNTKELMPPLGLSYIAAVLEKNNIEVEIMDAEVEKLSWKTLEKKCKESNPDLAGITSLTESRFESFNAAKILKNVLPNTMVVMGGPHASLAPEDTLLNVKSVDIVVRGEGEYTMVELCQAAENSRELKTIDGISYRENGKVVHNKNRQLMQDLDSIPFPAYHLLKMEKYDFRLEVPGKGRLPAMNIITSRGCPIGCTFCATSEMLGKKWRARSPLNVISELVHLIDNYNIKAIFFYDDTFTMNKKRAREICELMIDKGLNLKYICMTRIDALDKNLLKTMKESGCYRIHYGVESGSQRILDSVVEKKINLEQVKEVSTWMDDQGIIKNPFFMASFPDETLEDVRKTLDFMKEIGGEPSLSFLKVYPGTKIEKIAKEKGIIPEDFSWVNTPKDAIFSIPAIQGNAPIFIDKLSWEELSEIAMIWKTMRKDYSLQNRFFGFMKTARSHQDFLQILVLIKIYIKLKLLKKSVIR
jgi:anaerobic magnesium-protoporphyrin IX monomethyl ester cyclase